MSTAMKQKFDRNIEIFEYLKDPKNESFEHE